MKRSLLMSTFVVSSATRSGTRHDARPDGGRTASAESSRASHRCFRKFADHRHVPAGTLAKACIGRHQKLPTRSPSWAEPASLNPLPCISTRLDEAPAWNERFFQGPSVVCRKPKATAILYMAEESPMPFASVGPSRPHYLFLFLFQINSSTGYRSRVANKWGSKTGGFHRSISLPLSLVIACSSASRSWSIY